MNYTITNNDPMTGTTLGELKRGDHPGTVAMSNDCRRCQIVTPHSTLVRRGPKYVWVCADCRLITACDDWHWTKNEGSN